MFNIRKKISHYRRLIRFKVRLLRSNGDSLWHSVNRSRARHERAQVRHQKRAIANHSLSSRKKAPSTNFWTGKRQTHSHKAYRHRMASVRRSNRSHAPGGAWSSSSGKWY